MACPSEREVTRRRSLRSSGWQRTTGRFSKRELIIFAVTLHLSGRTRVSRADVEALFETFEARTLGQLLREAWSLTAIPLDLEGKLADALGGGMTSPTDSLRDIRRTSCRTSAASR